ncbi:LOW QUALITY PROTEIN: protocadherin alpha-5-like [Vipera latastei]
MRSSQLYYSIQEESQQGTFVSHIAQDLGLEVDARVLDVSVGLPKNKGNIVNVQSGILFVNSQIGREKLCDKSAMCIVHLDALVEKPLRIFHIEVEIIDINDNAPIFPVTERQFTIAESSLHNSNFPLEGASDADIGANSLLSYRLNPNLLFRLVIESYEHCCCCYVSYEHSVSLFLVLNKYLDIHRLFLLATDGGDPQLTGTVQLGTKVLDANGNPPVFNQSVYNVQILENSENEVVFKVNATDLDEGTNKEIAYISSNFSPTNGKEKFILDHQTGEIYVKGHLDFEERNFYEIHVEAKDNRNPPLSGHCKFLIEILDLNDKPPEITVVSLLITIPEDSPLGMVIALMTVSDRDTGDNGQVST